MVQKYRFLKRANALLTLERCTLEEAQRAVILQENRKHVARALAVKEARRAGKIVIDNPNVIPHLMQPKHNWDKLISLTGEIEKDCQQVLTLLEKHGIYSEQYLLEVIEIKRPNCIRKDYQMIIEGYPVTAAFLVHPETGEYALMNGWVMAL